MRFLFSVVFFLTTMPLAQAEKLVPYAGGGKEAENVPATQARLIQPFGIEFHPSGDAYIVELTGQRVLKVDPKGTFTIVGGTGKKGSSGDGGPARQATFNGMHNLAIAPDGTVYLADTFNSLIRKYDPKTGVVSAFGGSLEKGYSGDGGPAVKAQFNGVFCIALNPKGDKLYVTDLGNRRIRVIDLKTGIVELVAGNGEKGVPVDGSDAKTAPLVDPRACAVDRHGNVYILERGGNALRVVDAKGKIRTVVGTGKAGLSGDDGDGKDATLKGPKHLCIDLNDDVIIADTANHVIRRYSPKTGKITRIAGTGKMGSSGDGGDPLQVMFNEPHGVAVHPSGTLYIVDSMNHRVFRLEK